MSLKKLLSTERSHRRYPYSYDPSVNTTQSTDAIDLPVGVELKEFHTGIKVYVTYRCLPEEAQRMQALAVRNIYREIYGEVEAAAHEAMLAIHSRDFQSATEAIGKVLSLTKPEQ